MTHTPDEAASGTDVVKAKHWYRQLYVRVLVAIVVGIVLGRRWPDLGTSMEPIGTTFVGDEDGGPGGGAHHRVRGPID